MGKIVYVELLDRRGNIRERVKVDSFPAKVGRSYTNAVIVEDRLVSEEHLMLSLDSEGDIVMEDLNTVNGTRFSKSGELIARLRVPARGEVVILIGHTVLRLRGDDFAVGPVVPSRALFGPFGKYIENGMIAFLAFVVGFGLNILTFAQEISKKVIWSDLADMSLVLLVVFVFWTGFWSFLNRLVTHSFRFMTHLGISGIASIILLMLFTAKEYFEFLFPVQVAARVFEFGGFVVFFSMLLYGHLSVMSASSGWKRLLSSALISASIVTIVLLINYADRKEFSNEIHFSSVIKPIGRKWVWTQSSDEFFGNLHKLREKIDATVQEGSKEKMVKE
jgi:hypothetical protein